MGPGMQLPRIVLLASALTAASVAACATATPADDATLVHVDALLAPHRVTLLRASADGEARPATPDYDGADAIRWELRDASGTLVATGHVSDGRTARYEFGESGQVDGVADPRAAIGTVSVDVPNVSGSLSFWDGAGRIGTTPFEAVASTDGVIESSLVDVSKDVIGTPVRLSTHAASADNVKLLLVPDGYTEAELPAFRKVAANVATKLGQIPGYREHWDQFDVYAQDVRSQNSGIFDPSKGGTPKDTAFETSFGDGVKSPHRCVLPSEHVRASAVASLHQIAKSISADMVIIISNSTEYGGCAMPWERLAVMTANELGVRIVAHEMGHALFDLSDEYEFNPPTCDLGALKRGKSNVSSDLGALPWKDMIASSTAVPTTSASAGTVGAFEGGGYCAKGAYRPTANCFMRSLDADFCPVCRREVDRFFDRRKNPGPSSVVVKNSANQGFYVKCGATGAPESRCSGWTWVATGKSATVRTVDGRLVIDNSTVSGASPRWSSVAVTATSASLTVYPHEDPTRP